MAHPDLPDHGSIDRRGGGRCAALLSVLTARATAVTEAPWRPEAAAYRATLFFLNLKPIPWDDGPGRVGGTLSRRRDRNRPRRRR